MAKTVPSMQEHGAVIIYEYMNNEDAHRWFHSEIKHDPLTQLRLFIKTKEIKW